MKFLLDVCVSSRALQTFLVGQGHDVLSAVAVDPKASDEQLMALALQDERVSVTEDKDFGELIFVRRLPHDPIVRLVELSVDEQVRAMADLLEHSGAENEKKLRARHSASEVRRANLPAAAPF